MLVWPCSYSPSPDPLPGLHRVLQAGCGWPGMDSQREVTYSTKTRGHHLLGISEVDQGICSSVNKVLASESISGLQGLSCAFLNTREAKGGPSFGTTGCLLPPFKARPPSHHFHDPYSSHISLILYFVLIVLSTIGADSHKVQASLSLCVARVSPATSSHLGGLQVMYHAGFVLAGTVSVCTHGTAASSVSHQV